MKTTAVITLDKPIDEVWNFVSSIENLGLWVEGIEAPKQTSDGRTGVGTTYHSKYNYRGKSFNMDHEIYEFEPPHRLGTRSTEGPFAYDASLILAEAGGGTSVSNTVEAGSDSWLTSAIFTIGGPLVRKAMRGQLMKELRALKKELAS
jgi:uncharacterized protein YndB with AHSA1/START domain